MFLIIMLGWISVGALALSILQGMDANIRNPFTMFCVVVFGAPVLVILMVLGLFVMAWDKITGNKSR